MKEEFVLSYHPYVQSFMKFIRIAAIVMMIPAIFLMIGSTAIGLKVLYSLIIVFLLIGVLYAQRHIKAPLTLDKNGIMYKKKAYPYKNISQVKEINNRLYFCQGDQTLFTLNEFYFQSDDLIAMNNHLEDVSLGIEETIEHFALEKLMQPKVSSLIFGLTSFIGLAYIIAFANGLYRYRFICFLLSIVMPLLYAFYYCYLLVINKKEEIMAHRAGYLLSMVIPAFIGLGDIFFIHSTDSMNAIITASLFLFIMLFVVYIFHEHIRMIGHDLLFVIFMMIDIPLLLITLNVNISLSTTTITRKVASVNVQNTKMINVYNAKYITSVDHLQTVVKTKAGQGKKPGDQITIYERNGFFNTNIDEKKVTIKAIKKISSGYQVYYDVPHYNRIMITEKEALSLKPGDKMAIQVKNGLLGVRDYQYIKKVES